jgi:hypothetical protein
MKSTAGPRMGERGWPASSIGGTKAVRRPVGEVRAGLEQRFARGVQCICGRIEYAKGRTKSPARAPRCSPSLLLSVHFMIRARSHGAAIRDNCGLTRHHENTPPHFSSRSLSSRPSIFRSSLRPGQPDTSRAPRSDDEDPRSGGSPDAYWHCTVYHQSARLLLPDTKSFGHDRHGHSDQCR